MGKLNVEDFLTTTHSHFSINMRKVENGVIVAVSSNTGTKEYVFSGDAATVKAELIALGLGEFVE